MKQYASMRTIASELMSTGHQVEFYVRKDGGILITNIDGQKFRGGEGNKRARAMTGQTLSEARFTQLKYATGTRKELNKPSLKKTTITDPIMEEYKRVKKLWNKAFKAKGGKSHPAGYFGISRIKKSIRDFGEKEALRRIGEAEKYASGIAYSKNVEILASQIEIAGANYESAELIKVAQDLRANAYSTRDEWIEPAYKELYRLNKGADTKEVANNVRKILRLPL